MPCQSHEETIREKVFIDYSAAAVCFYTTTLEGTEITGYGIAYKGKGNKGGQKQKTGSLSP